MSNVVFYDNEVCSFGEITAEFFYGYKWDKDKRYIFLENYDPVVDPKGFYEIRAENQDNPLLKKSQLETLLKQTIGD